MAKRNRRKSKSQGPRRRKSNATELRQLRKLSDLGLYQGDTSRVTGYGRKQIRQFGDVLRGEAKAVRVRSPIAARKYIHFKTKFRTVVIPKRPGERVFYSKNSGEIFSYRKEYGHTIKRIIPKSPLRADQVSLIRKGKRVRYVIPIGGPDHYERFSSFEDLQAFMQPYETTHIVRDKYGVRPVSYKDWHKYVEIEIVDPDEMEE